MDCAASCWVSVSCFVFQFGRAALLLSFFPIAFYFPFFFVFFFLSNLFLFSFLVFLFVTRNSLVCWVLHALVSCRRAHCGSHRMAKSPCCICNLHLRLAVCDLRESPSLKEDSAARTLAVLDVDGWKYQFHAKNTQQAASIARRTDSHRNGCNRNQPTCQVRALVWSEVTARPASLHASPST